MPFYLKKRRKMLFSEEQKKSFFNTESLITYILAAGT